VNHVSSVTAKILRKKAISYLFAGNTIKAKLNLFNVSCLSKEIAMKAVAYLCKVAPMTKFKCAHFLVIQILNIGTIFTKDKP